MTTDGSLLPSGAGRFDASPCVLGARLAGQPRNRSSSSRRPRPKGRSALARIEQALAPPSATLLKRGGVVQVAVGARIHAVASAPSPLCSSSIKASVHTHSGARGVAFGGGLPPSYPRGAGATLHAAGTRAPGERSPGAPAPETRPKLRLNAAVYPQLRTRDWMLSEQGRIWGAPEGTPAAPLGAPGQTAIPGGAPRAAPATADNASTDGHAPGDPGPA